jgi:translation initiation factor 6
MGILKTSISGNSFVGAYCIATDKFAIVGRSASLEVEKRIAEALKVKAYRLNINGSSLVGIYLSANSNGILLPNITDDREAEEIRRTFPGMSVSVLETGPNALRSNILANDRIAIINPEYSTREAAEIGDVLGVEVVRMAVGGYGTVGANNILTNRGIAVNNRAAESETDELKRITHMDSDNATANLGSVSIGLCAVANSGGLVIGNESSGFEISRIASALGI